MKVILGYAGVLAACGFRLKVSRMTAWQEVSSELVGLMVTESKSLRKTLHFYGVWLRFIKFYFPSPKFLSRKQNYQDVTLQLSCIDVKMDPSLWTAKQARMDVTKSFEMHGACSFADPCRLARFFLTKSISHCSGNYKSRRQEEVNTAYLQTQIEVPEVPWPCQGFPCARKGR